MKTQLSIRIHGLSYCCSEARSRGGCERQDDEVKPSQATVDLFGSDAPEVAEDALRLAVAIARRLNVRGAAHPCAGRRVGRLVAHTGRGHARGPSAIGTCSRRSPRLLALPPRWRALYFSYRSPLRPSGEPGRIGRPGPVARTRLDRRCRERFSRR